MEGKTKMPFDGKVFISLFPRLPSSRDVCFSNFFLLLLLLRSWKWEMYPEKFNCGGGGKDQTYLHPLLLHWVKPSWKWILLPTPKMGKKRVYDEGEGEGGREREGGRGKQKNRHIFSFSFFLCCCRRGGGTRKCQEIPSTTLHEKRAQKGKNGAETRICDQKNSLPLPTWKWLHNNKLDFLGCRCIIEWISGAGVKTLILSLSPSPSLANAGLGSFSYKGFFFNKNSVYKTLPDASVTRAKSSVTGGKPNGCLVTQQH